MQSPKAPAVLLRRSTWWIGSLFGAVAVLAFAGLEGAHPAHRHLIDDEIVTHDHLDGGPHHHPQEPPRAPRDREDPARPPANGQVYLGEALVPLADDLGSVLVVAAPEVGRGSPGTEARDASHSPDLFRPPQRGPPASLLAAS